MALNAEKSKVSELERLLGLLPILVLAGHQNLFTFADGQAFCQFPGGRGFTRALQTYHQNRSGWVVYLQIARFAFATQGVNQSVMDDLDHLLAGGDRFCDS